MVTRFGRRGMLEVGGPEGAARVRWVGGRGECGVEVRAGLTFGVSFVTFLKD